MPQITLTAEIQPEQMGQRLDQTLAELFPEYSRSRLKTWIEAKQVKMNGEIADIPRTKVYGGEQIEISGWNSLWRYRCRVRPFPHDRCC